MGVCKVEEIQWMHFAAIGAGKPLDRVQQTIGGKEGVLGKRLSDALADLFGSDDQDEILALELLVFDADDEYAWINPELFYFVAVDEITAEHRFAAMSTWRALAGAVAMRCREHSGVWLSLQPGKKSFHKLMDSQAFQSDPSDTLFHMLELLVRGTPDPPEKTIEPADIDGLIRASKNDDQEAAHKLEAAAWQAGDVDLWRYAMAVADGKSYLARMFEERIGIKE